MIEPRVSMGRQIGEKAVRATIAVVGLLVLRLILSMLPMLKHPMLYPSSASAYMIQGVPQTFSSIPIQQVQQAIQQILSGVLAGQSLAQQAQWLMEAHFAIFPVTIAKAVVDTLIFIVLLLFGRDVGSIVRTGYARLPDLGPMLTLGVVTVVVAFAYHSYQGIFYPLLWPENLDAYGWIFLALGLAPLIGVVVLVSRNIDAITAAVMHSGARAVDTASPAATVACGSCGQRMAAGTKFCPNCAAPVTAPAAAAGPAKKFCSSCGGENPAAAKFCGGCGQSLVS